MQVEEDCASTCIFVFGVPLAKWVGTWYTLYMDFVFWEVIEFQSGISTGSNDRAFLSVHSLGLVVRKGVRWQHRPCL